MLMCFHNYLGKIDKDISWEFNSWYYFNDYKFLLYNKIKNGSK